MEKSKARKSYLIVAMLLLLVLVSLGIGFVMAYGTSNPPFVGHSFGEINWDCRVEIGVQSSPTSTYTCGTGGTGYTRLISGGCDVQLIGSFTTAWIYNRPSTTTPNTWHCYMQGGYAKAYALCCKT